MSEEQAVLDHLREKIRSEFSSRDDELAKETSLIVRQASVAGRLASGNTAHSLGENATQDIRIRGNVLMKALADVWASYRPDPSVAPLARQLVLDALQEAAAARDTGVRNNALTRTVGPVFDGVWEGFRVKYENEIRRIDLSLREWVHSQQLPAVSAGMTQSTTVNLTGSNNVVVAGLIHSAANVHMDAASTARILDALAGVRQAMETCHSLPKQEVADTLELVGDAEEQLKRTEPNKKKLFSSLQGIAGSIQTVGALGDAYSNLKSAMALIGLPLP